MPLGSTEPRLWTPPLRELTPDTSYGFDACEFASDVVERPFDPWQQWLAIHAGELLPDGRPRFRIVLVLVARQNGKTEVLVILSLYWLFVEFRKLILGTSTNLDYAKESWEKALALAEETDDLADEIAPRGIRRTNGEQTLTTVDRCRYKIAASNRKGGRSLTIHRLIMDELREHQDWSAYNAAVPAMNAVPDAQAFLISNQGDERSVVLRSLRKAALAFIKTGKGDHRLGLFEWSSPEGSDPEDPVALAQANPNAGRRLHWDDLLGPAQRAKEAGGAELAGFKTEVMCMDVPILDPAIDAMKWGECLDIGDLEAQRAGVAACVDLSLDGQHATLAAAALLPDNRVRVEIVKAWAGPDCTRELRRDLPGLVAKVRPRVLGWFPSGPAAAVAAELADRKQRGTRVAWPPPGVKVAEITGEAAAVCMGFAEQIDARQIAQSDDPLLNAQLLGTQKLHQGARWVFTRVGVGHCDASYASAGAVHLARTLPPPPPAPRVVTSTRRRNR